MVIGKMRRTSYAIFPIGSAPDAWSPNTSYKYTSLLADGVRTECFVFVGVKKAGTRAIMCKSNVHIYETLSIYIWVENRIFKWQFGYLIYNVKS